MSRSLKRWLSATGVVALLAAPALVVTSPAFGAAAPGSNTKCADLGPYFHEIKIEGTGGTVTENGVTVTAESANGQVTSWTSTVPVDFVIVKAGSTQSGAGSAVYKYDPEATSGGPLAILGDKQLSHISFCYDYELTVAKTADTSFTRTYDWTLDKSVDPESLTMLAGESGDVEYTVAATRTETDSDWMVSGDITVSNDTPDTAVVTDVADTMGLMDIPVTCPALPATLEPGESLSCTYSASLDAAFNGDNVATVTTSRSTATPVAGNTATAPVAFTEPTTVEGPESINVDDVASDGFTATFPFGDDGTATYPRTFECSTDPADYTNGSYTYTVDNTATIRETGASDSATVDVTCYAPTAAKTADAAFDRTYLWNIDKSVDQSEVTVEIGEAHTLNYTVTVTRTAEDSGYAVAGAITVTNPSPDREMTVTITDSMADTLSCGGTLTIPAGGTATCEYSGALDSADNLVNVAQVSMNGYVTEATADVVFGEPATTTDACVNVSDVFNGGAATPLGTNICDDQTFTYAQTVSYDQAGCYPVNNTATATATDSGTSVSDAANANICVNEAPEPPADTCTATVGYWKTHSSYGPARYDDAWMVNGVKLEDAAFFTSGQTYYQVLMTEPRGNAYYILAHQWIAATLNASSGADVPPEVADALAAGQALLEQYTPQQVAALKGSARAAFINAAGTLDAYNNGLIGPGHCG